MTERLSIPARAIRKIRRLRRPRPDPASEARVQALSERVRKLSTKVNQLEEDLLEARMQGRRIAELSDLVTELLVSEGRRRDPEFQQIVDKYVRE